MREIMASVDLHPGDPSCRTSSMRSIELSHAHSAPVLGNAARNGQPHAGQAGGVPRCMSSSAVVLEMDAAAEERHVGGGMSCMPLMDNLVPSLDALFGVEGCGGDLMAPLDASLGLGGGRKDNSLEDLLAADC